MQIAIVDDDAIARKILRVGLTRQGYEVEEFSDGLAAWEGLQHSTSRLIITDWMMPGMDGLELIRRLRSAGLEGYLYIILLTGRDDQSDIIAGLEAGADDYLVKPFDINELRARVNIGNRILSLESDLKAARNRMEYIAMHDSLTGIFNRRAIYIHLDGELNRARRSNQSMSVLMLDIDKFKTVNDTYGHLIGDRALILVSEQICAAVRNYDWVGRWGGDEFLVILPSTAIKQAQCIAERIQNGLRINPLELPDGTRIEINASIGVVNHPPAEVHIDHIIHQVDTALYQAKADGLKIVLVQCQPEDD